MMKYFIEIMCNTKTLYPMSFDNLVHRWILILIIMETLYLTLNVQPLVWSMKCKVWNSTTNENTKWPPSLCWYWHDSIISIFGRNITAFMMRYWMISASELGLKYVFRKGVLFVLRFFACLQVTFLTTTLKVLIMF